MSIPHGREATDEAHVEVAGRRATRRAVRADVAVVADGGPGAGLGHLGRSSAIAAALRARGVAVSCHAYGAAEPVTVDGIAWSPLDEPPAPAGGVVVLDTYTMPETDRAALAERFAVALMHDVGGILPAATLVVAVGRREDEIAMLGTPVLAGLRYAALRAPFWGLPVRHARARVRRVLVTTGGGTLQDAGVALAAQVKAALPGASVALVRGPRAHFTAPPGVELVNAPRSLVDELLAADIVVTAAGQSALEAVATGAATVALALVDNQRRNATMLAATGAARVLEPGADIAATVGHLAGDRAERAALAERGQTPWTGSARYGSPSASPGYSGGRPSGPAAPVRTSSSIGTAASTPARARSRRDLRSVPRLPRRAAPAGAGEG